MKKILCSLFCLSCLGIASFAQITTSVLLQHQSNVVVYSCDSLNAALRDAVDGDTLFLSEGTFPGFTIDKKITVRGAGQGTIVSGDITVAIPDSATLTATLLEGFYKSRGEITVTQPVNGFRMKQCSFYRMTLDADMEDVVIDRCHCSGYIKLAANKTDYPYVTKVRSMKVLGSRVMAFSLEAETSNYITLVNCMTKGFQNGQYFKGTVINSIVGWPGNAQYTYSGCAFINSLICTYRLGFGSLYEENCWTSDDQYLVKNPGGDTFYCIYSDEELLELGYIGNDGTVIGSNGGATPYTVELAVPKVKSADLKLDNANRLLNVNLTLTAE